MNEAQFFNILESLRISCSSSVSTVELNTVLTRSVMHTRTAEFIMDCFYDRNHSSHHEIVDMYNRAFGNHKNSVSMRSSQGRDGKSVHQVVGQLLSLALKMVNEVHPDVGNQYRQICGARRNTVENTAMALKKEVDFSIVDRELYDSAQNPCTIYMLLPIEVKQIGHHLSAITQSIGYLLERIMVQYECCRDLSQIQEGWACGTDGVEIVVAHVWCGHGQIKIQRQEMAHFRDDALWPSEEDKLTVDELELKHLPGFVNLLALLTFGRDSLGYTTVVNAFGKEGWTAYQALGTGAFCSAMLARVPGRGEVVLKLPQFVLEHASPIPAAQLAHEAALLAQMRDTLLSAGINIDREIPHCLEYHAELPALVLRDVGINLGTFVGQRLWLIEKRREFAASLRVQLKDLLRHVHAHCGVTHRDVRPQNIVMVPTAGEYIPQLIDWGWAHHSSVAYHCASLSDHAANFAADEIVQRRLEDQKSKTSIAVHYFADYDIRSVDFTAAAIIYAWCDFAAPWHLASGWEEYYKLRDFLTEEASVRTYTETEINSKVHVICRELKGQGKADRK